jgi:hypothetical protein
MEQVKLQGQMQLEQAKMELEREKVGMQLGFEQQKMQADYTLRSSAQDADIAIKREGQAADQELAREAQSMTPAQNGDTPGPRSKKATMGPIGDAIKALGEMMIAQNAQAEQRHAESMEAIAAGQAQMMQVMAAPQKVIRDRNGQIIGAAKDIRVN